MKLIIDINEELYEQAIRDKDYHDATGLNDINDYSLVIAQGIPYDERPQGEWIEHGKNYDSHSHRMFVSCECSACHMYEDFPEDDETGNVLTSHYCKWCGSNMWKEEQE